MCDSKKLRFTKDQEASGFLDDMNRAFGAFGKYLRKNLAGNHHKLKVVYSIKQEIKIVVILMHLFITMVYRYTYNAQKIISYHIK